MNTTTTPRQASGHAPLMSRIEVSGLLAMMAAFRGRTPSETELRWWRDALAGYTAAECQAAILAHSKTSPNHISPADITGRIREAHRLREARTRRGNSHPDADRRQYSQAARLGMRAIYAQMAWTRRPDQAAALTVRCPVPGCAAEPEVICAPVNKPERRDPATRVHPSRLAAGEQAAEDAHREGVSA